MKCYLSEDINACPYFINNECSNENVCSYQNRKMEEMKREKYVRQPRWYEKYYERRR